MNKHKNQITYGVCVYIHMVFAKTLHGTQSCHKCHLSNTRKADLNWSLEAKYVNYTWMYLQMLTTCAIDNKGGKFVKIMNGMFFMVTSNTFANNQNLAFMIINRLVVYSMNVYHRCPYKI